MPELYICRVEGLVTVSSVFSWCAIWTERSHSGAVVTHSPPTSEVCGLNPELYVRKMVVFTDGQQFTVQSLDQLKTTHHDMTYTMLKAT